MHDKPKICTINRKQGKIKNKSHNQLKRLKTKSVPVHGGLDAVLKFKIKLHYNGRRKLMTYQGVL